MSELEKVSEANLGVYKGFLALTKWAVLFVSLVLIVMAIFLV